MVQPPSIKAFLVGSPLEAAALRLRWLLNFSQRYRHPELWGIYLEEEHLPRVLQRLLKPSPPQRARLVVGYAGWGPGQLEAELEQSAWLLSDVDTDLIFDTPPDRMWEAAIRRLGADPATLQMSRGVH